MDHQKLIPMSLIKVPRGNDIPYLPNDIVFNEILSRVPSEVLYTWRFVCRSWFHQLNGNTTFINSQLAMSQPSFILENRDICYSLYSEVKLEFNDTSMGYSVLSDKFPNMSEKSGITTRIELMSACNGLILLVRYHVSCSTYHDSGSTCIANPTTKEWVTLPSTDNPPLAGGLGYDPSGKKYKAVLFFQGFSKGGKRGPHHYWWCEVLTLGDEKWRKVKGRFVSKHVWRHAVVAGGFMHFEADHSIISMDIAKETFRRRKVPWRFWALFKLDGHLALSRHRDARKSHRIDIWVFQGSNRWERKHNIRLVDGEYFNRITRHTAAIASLRNGEVIIFNSLGRRLFYYDTLNKTFGQLMTEWTDDDALVSCQFGVSLVSDHVSTLISPLVLAGRKQIGAIG